MITVDYPADHVLYDAVWHGGRFWVVTRDPAADVWYETGGNVWGVASPGEPARAFRFPPAESRRLWRYSRPVVVAGHPRIDGPALARLRVGRYGLTAVRFDGGKAARLPGFPHPEEYPVPEDHHDANTAWYDANVRPYVVPGASNVAYDDRVVAMSGSAAAAHSALVMGPTAAAAVRGVRGLNKNHLVVYRRGETGARVVRMPGQNNPTAVVLAGDGATVLAACRHRAFVWDVDD